MKKNSVVAALLVLSIVLGSAVQAARAKIPAKTCEPYLGAIVVEADTGEAIIEENADVTFYPASIVKLMMLLIIQEKLEDGSLDPGDRVTATAEASKMGGSQVYLAENEVFTIEDLLYAIMIQSANDAAVALAIHVVGSKEGFVEMMQQKADELGMKDTRFHSVHGLPPGEGQKPDASSPHDIALMGRELLKHPDILKYTSTQVRTFRENPPFEMRSHNKLLGSFNGCDGLKTGYFRAGGFSIVATAEKNGTRLVAVVAGAKEKKVRDASARKLLARAFSRSPSKPPAASSVPAVQPEAKQRQPAAEPDGPPPSWNTPAIDTDPVPRKEGSVVPVKLILLIAVLAGVFFWLGRLSRRGPRPSSKFLIK